MFDRPINALRKIIRAVGKNAASALTFSDDGTWRPSWVHEGVSTRDTVVTCELETLDFFSRESDALLMVTATAEVPGRSFPTTCIISISTNGQRVDQQLLTHEVVVKEWLMRPSPAAEGAASVVVPVKTIANLATIIDPTLSSRTRIFLTLRFVGCCDGTDTHRIKAARLEYITPYQYHCKEARRHREASTEGFSAPPSKGSSRESRQESSDCGCSPSLEPRSCTLSRGGDDHCPRGWYDARETSYRSEHSAAVEVHIEESPLPAGTTSHEQVLSSSRPRCDYDLVPSRLESHGGTFDGVNRERAPRAEIVQRTAMQSVERHSLSPPDIDYRKEAIILLADDEADCPTSTWKPRTTTQQDGQCLSTFLSDREDGPSVAGQSCDGETETAAARRESRYPVLMIDAESEDYCVVEVPTSPCVPGSRNSCSANGGTGATPRSPQLRSWSRESFAGMRDVEPEGIHGQGVPAVHPGRSQEGMLGDVAGACPLRVAEVERVPTSPNSPQRRTGATVWATKAPPADQTSAPSPRRQRGPYSLPHSTAPSSVASLSTSDCQSACTGVEGPSAGAMAAPVPRPKHPELGVELPATEAPPPVLGVGHHPAASAEGTASRATGASTALGGAASARRSTSYSPSIREPSSGGGAINIGGPEQWLFAVKNKDKFTSVKALRRSECRAGSLEPGGPLWASVTGSRPAATSRSGTMRESLAPTAFVRLEQQASLERAKRHFTDTLGDAFEYRAEDDVVGLASGLLGVDRLELLHPRRASQIDPRPRSAARSGCGGDSGDPAGGLAAVPVPQERQSHRGPGTNTTAPTPWQHHPTAESWEAPKGTPRPPEVPAPAVSTGSVSVGPGGTQQGVRLRKKSISGDIAHGAARGPSPPCVGVDASRQAAAAAVSAPVRSAGTQQAQRVPAAISDCRSPPITARESGCALVEIPTLRDPPQPPRVPSPPHRSVPTSRYHSSSWLPGPKSESGAAPAINASGSRSPTRVLRPHSADGDDDLTELSSEGDDYHGISGPVRGFAATGRTFSANGWSYDHSLTSSSAEANGRCSAGAQTATSPALSQVDVRETAIVVRHDREGQGRLAAPAASAPLTRFSIEPYEQSVVPMAGDAAAALAPSDTDTDLSLSLVVVEARDGLPPIADSAAGRSQLLVDVPKRLPGKTLESHRSVPLLGMAPTPGPSDGGTSHLDAPPDAVARGRAPLLDVRPLAAVLLVHKHHASRRGTGKRIFSVQQEGDGSVIVTLRKVDTGISRIRLGSSTARKNTVSTRLMRADGVSLLTGPQAFHSNVIHKEKVRVAEHCAVIARRGQLVTALEVQSEGDLRSLRAVLQVVL